MDLEQGVKLGENAIRNLKDEPAQDQKISIRDIILNHERVRR